MKDLDLTFSSGGLNEGDTTYINGSGEKEPKVFKVIKHVYYKVVDQYNNIDWPSIEIVEKDGNIPLLECGNASIPIIDALNSDMIIELAVSLRMHYDTAKLEQIKEKVSLLIKTYRNEL